MPPSTTISTTGLSQLFALGVGEGVTEGLGEPVGVRLGVDDFEREFVREADQSSEEVAVAVREGEVLRVRVRVRVPLAVGITDSLAVEEAEGELLGLRLSEGDVVAVPEALAPSLTVALLLAVEEGEGVPLGGGGSQLHVTCTGVPGSWSRKAVTTTEKREKALTGEPRSETSGRTTWERSPHPSNSLSSFDAWQSSRVPLMAGAGQPVPTKRRVSMAVFSLHVLTTIEPPEKGSVLLSSTKSLSSRPSLNMKASDWLPSLNPLPSSPHCSASNR